ILHDSSGYPYDGQKKQEQRQVQGTKLLTDIFHGSQEYPSPLKSDPITTSLLRSLHSCGLKYYAKLVIGALKKLEEISEESCEIAQEKAERRKKELMAMEGIPIHVDATLGREDTLLHREDAEDSDGFSRSFSSDDNHGIAETPSSPSTMKLHQGSGLNHSLGSSPSSQASPSTSSISRLISDQITPELISELFSDIDSSNKKALKRFYDHSASLVGRGIDMCFDGDVIAGFNRLQPALFLLAPFTRSIIIRTHSSSRTIPNDMFFSICRFIMTCDILVDLKLEGIPLTQYQALLISYSLSHSFASTSLTSLSILGIHLSNSLAHSLFPPLFHLRALNSVTLSACDLLSSVVPFVTSLVHHCGVERLVLDGNNLSSHDKGSLLFDLSKCFGSLKSLSLNECHLTDQDLVIVANGLGHSISHLYLCYNYLETPKVVVKIANMMAKYNENGNFIPLINLLHNSIHSSFFSKFSIRPNVRIWASSV
ncbi:hypothetical protein ADUPG1_006483, partial [Aduncisulcus paluster]